MGLVGVFSFFGCGKQRAVVEQIDSPPFTIQKIAKSEKSFNMNYGRMSKHTYSDYRILYHGQPITFPSALESNTGYSGLWKAYILKDAPKPAIIAGSQNVFLITENESGVNFRIIAEQQSGFSSLQWLDSENGKPGINQQIYLSDDTDSTCILAGGKYLLVNENAVLDLSDLAFYPFKKHSAGLEDYYPGKVIDFSPDQTQVVFVGSRSVHVTQFEYGLISFDYKRDTAYVVSFDQTETRMQDIYDITPTWLETFFEWTTTGEARYILKKRELDQLPVWQGRYSDGGAYFNLEPAKEEMKGALKEFVIGLLELSDSNFIEKEGNIKESIHFEYAGHTYTIGSFPELKQVHFSKYLFENSSDENLKLIKKVGDAFNEALRAGKYQDLFTTY